MIVRQQHRRRPGATFAEAAIVYPVLLLFTLGLIVVGLGICRYQQTAALAREGSRWASVHGGQWAIDYNGNTLTTPEDVYNNAIKPHCVLLDTSGMTFSSTGGSGTHLSFTVSWADAGEMPTYTASGKTKRNTVTVTVNYQWVPELYLGSMKLSSTSQTTISY